jgi:uncharacterized protein (DUF1810 family)
MLSSLCSHDGAVSAVPGNPGLSRFVAAQEGVFDTALVELRSGRKQTHWMWFIFPQLVGLGRSPTAQYYGIASADEARAYLAHSLLGHRLRQCVEELLPWGSRRAPEQIFGEIDAMKLRSSLTLFAAVAPNSEFDRALDLLFHGQSDERTLALLHDAR